MENVVAVSGRRDLQHWETDYLISCGEYLRRGGYIMTNGGAAGADAALATGFICSPGKTPLWLYLPWKGFKPATGIEDATGVCYADSATSWQRQMAKRSHPAWSRLSQGVRQLMIRNAMLLAPGDAPVSVLWAYPDRMRRGWGGTGATIRCAVEMGIEVILLPEGIPYSGGAS